MPWIELSVGAASEAVDWVSMIIAASAFRDNVIVVEPTTAASDEPMSDMQTAWEYTVRVFAPHDAPIERGATALDQELGALRRARLVGDLYIEEVEHLPLLPEAIRSAPQRIGQHFVILSAEHEAALEPLDRVLRLAPGGAFGTGLHPATRVSLEMLERYAAPGTYALDLGSGSGILSVALARMGARVLALDNDPLAARATEETVSLNGLDHMIAVAAGSLGGGADLGHWMGGTQAVDSTRVDDDHVFDLVVANLFARIHVAVAPDYQQAVKPNGVLITAGFTIDREDEVSTRLQDLGFEPLDRVEAGEWIALAHRRTIDENHT